MCGRVAVGVKPGQCAHERGCLPERWDSNTRDAACWPCFCRVRLVHPLPRVPRPTLIHVDVHAFMWCFGEACPPGRLDPVL